MSCPTPTLDTGHYSNLVSTRSAIYSSNIKALTTVRQFIIANNLILVGGMAIDFALKLAGDKLYSDDQLPDYDFYSPSHTAHAYELASLLCKAGFPNISCIQAAHMTTMRVRIDFETVADITYCPLTVYKKIPTLIYDRLRLVHPHYQMIDQHSSLSLPFQDAGREVIFNRWRKDMTRYDKLYKYYPVVPILELTPFALGVLHTPPPKGGGRNYIRTPDREKLAKYLELPLRTVRVRLADIGGSCISGWGGVDYKIDTDGEYVDLLIPEGEPITLASDDYKSFVSRHGLTSPEYYSEYFGKIPRSLVCSSKQLDTKGLSVRTEIYDTFGMKVAAKKISEKHDVYVCNLQWSMLYLLIKVFSSHSPSIVFTAEEQYLRCRQLVEDGMVPSIEVYGQHNFTHAYLNRLKKDKEKIYSIKADNLQPSNAYPRPPGCTTDKEFDPEQSEYFKTDNRRLPNFVEWTLDPYPSFNALTPPRVPPK